MKLLKRAIVGVLGAVLLAACASDDGGPCGGVTFKSDVPFTPATSEPGGAARRY